MKNYANFEQVLNDLQNLNQTIEDIRQRMVNLIPVVAYGSQDARHLALEGVQCDIGACGNWISVLMALKCLCKEKFGNNWDENYRKMIRTRLSSSQSEDLMLDYLRNTITTKVHFKIENVFFNILRELRALPKNPRFWNLSDAMLAHLGMSTTGQEKKILTILAYLRNSYHANGMHRKDDLSINIDGVTFEFHKGKRVECNSWRHIIKVLQANISVLESILFSQEVLSLKHIIRDDFTCVD